MKKHACIFLSILSACSPSHQELSTGIDGRKLMHHHETGNFRLEDVSCTDESTPEINAALESIRNNPQGDLFLIAHIDEILALSRYAANQGSPHAMWTFGGLKHEILMMEYKYSVNKNLSHSIFFDIEKKDMVTALTYIYMASVKENADSHAITNTIESIEKNSSDIRISSKWIEEAKENAKRWKERCQ